MTLVNTKVSCALAILICGHADLEEIICSVLIYRFFLSHISMFKITTSVTILVVIDGRHAMTWNHL